MSIFNKLLKIQSELKAPKGQYNSFGKYKYRSCEDILESVKPLLEKHDCVLTISDTMEVVGDRYYIKARAIIIDSSSNGEDAGSISVTAYAREPENKKGMDESQITGAASSYARKYALNGLFAIDDTKDADATNDHKETQTTTSDVEKLYYKVFKTRSKEEYEKFIAEQSKTYSMEQIKIFLNKKMALAKN